MSLFDRFLKPLKKFLKLKKARKTKKRLKKKKLFKKPKASKKVRRILSRRSGKIKNSLVRSKKQKTKSVAKQKLLKENLVGEITHFFSKIQVVVIKMTHGQIQAGDRIHIRGKKTNFYQTVKSLQIESVDVKTVHKGQLAGLKVNQSAKEGDKVYLPA